MSIYDSKLWIEYDACAEWQAKRGLCGKPGSALPENVSAACANVINGDPEAFAERVRDCAYAIAMNKLQLPENDI